MLGLSSSLVKGGASLLTFVKDNLKLYLDFKSNKSDTLKFPSEGSTEFDGSSNYIETSDSADFDFGTGDFSISFWFNVDDIDWNWAVSRVNSSNNNDVFRAGTNNSGKIIFRDIVGGVDVAGSTTISINTWYHFFAVRNSGTLKVYLNGSEDGSASSSGNLDSDKGFIIGRWQGNGDYWNGQLTNVAVWSRALTPEEIQSIMNKSYSQLKGVEKTSLVSWWALDSASNGVIQPHDGETLGADQVTNGTFDTDSNWSKNTGWSIGSGVASCDGSQTGNTGLIQQGTILGANLDFEVGKTYKITFDVTTTAGAITYIEIGGATDHTDVPTSDSTVTRYITATSTNDRLTIAGNSTFEGTVDNVVVKEVTSNTGVVTGATTTTSVYGGNAPILPRAVDVAKEGQADAIGNGSALFNGSTDYIDLGDKDLFSFGNGTVDQPLSITLWANLDSDTQNMLLSKGVYNNNGEYVLWSNSSNKLSFELYNGANYELAHTTSTITSYENEWIHIGVTYNGVGGSSANAGIKIYINGISQALTLSDNGTYTAMPNTTSNLHIGNYNNLQYKADGELSQLGIWKGELTQAQIQSVMESTSYSKIPADVKSTTSTLVTDGGWTIGGSWVYDSSTGYYTNTYVNGTDTPIGNIIASPTTTQGNLYKLSYTVVSTTGSPTLKFPSNMLGLSSSNIPYTVGQTNVHYGVDDGSSENIGIRSNTGVGTIVLKDIKFEEVTNDIVAYYPLDGSSEVKGLSFTTDDYIQLPVPFSYTNHSISVWAKHGTTGSAIFDARDSSSDGARIGIDSSGRLQYKVNGSNALVATAYTNQWVHYFCTYDGTRMRVYVNGVEAKTNATEQTIDTTTNARIGRNSYSTGYFDGSISSLALYSVTKSADEALAIYNDGIGGDESSNSNLVGYYKLDNASTVSDLSSNTNDGTVYGATLISAGTTDSVGNNDGGLL